MFALAALATFAASGPAQADWSLFGRDSELRLYLDQGFQRNGDLVQTVQLMDFTTAKWTETGTVIGSIRLVVEYDCRQPRSRILSSEAFAEQMAGGRKVGEERLTEPVWEVLDPVSSAAKIRRIACETR